MSKHDARAKSGDERKDVAGKSAAPKSGKAPKRAEITGVVVDVFGRRFTLEADAARTLVDLGKRGAGLIVLEPGARLTVLGQRKAGEVKAVVVTREGGLSFTLRKGKRALEAPSARAEGKTADKADTGKADAGKTDAGKTGADPSDAGEAKEAKSGAKASGAAKSVGAKPVAAKPVAAKPVVAKPVAAKPVAAKTAAKPARNKPAGQGAAPVVKAAKPEPAAEAASPSTPEAPAKGA